VLEISACRMCRQQGPRYGPALASRAWGDVPVCLRFEGVVCCREFHLAQACQVEEEWPNLDCNQAAKHEVGAAGPFQAACCQQLAAGQRLAARWTLSVMLRVALKWPGPNEYGVSLLGWEWMLLPGCKHGFLASRTWNGTDGRTQQHASSQCFNPNISEVIRHENGQTAKRVGKHSTTMNAHDAKLLHGPSYLFRQEKMQRSWPLGC
jgi:hypothetical protein